MSAPTSAIESVLVENRVFPPSDAIVKAARVSGMAGYDALCAEAEKDFEGFWARQARGNLQWTKPFTRTLDESNAPFFQWFADGELNASANCLDRHIGTATENKTAIIFEGIPTFPNAGRFWQMIERHKCTIFYTAPTAIRSLIKAAEADEAVHPARSDLSSLRILGSVGEPINPEAWMWYHKNVGGERCPIVDTFWQTETGGHVITPLPGATPLVPGSCTLPLPGITAAIVDEMGNDVPNGAGGILVIKRPWPSMIRTIWNDPERFKKSYFPEELKGYYLAGDGAVRSADRGYFRITGRIDDVLNVSGHRMGTMEIESALVAKTDLVAEAAVVGRPDDVTGEAICAFVVLKRSRPTGEEAKQIANELRNWVAKEIGPIAKPKDIRFGDNLPKTRSGKIMRRLRRSIAKGEAITQDTSTLENPAILDQLAQTN